MVRKGDGKQQESRPKRATGPTRVQLPRQCKAQQEETPSETSQLRVPTSDPPTSTALPMGSGDTQPESELSVAKDSSTKNVTEAITKNPQSLKPSKSAVRTPRRIGKTTSTEPMETNPAEPSSGKRSPQSPSVKPIPKRGRKNLFLDDSPSGSDEPTRQQGIVEGSKSKELQSPKASSPSVQDQSQKSASASLETPITGTARPIKEPLRTLDFSDMDRGVTTGELSSKSGSSPNSAPKDSELVSHPTESRVPFIFTDPDNDPPPPLAEGHKLVHIVRHCRAWHNLVKTRGSESLHQIHDPGLTPGGHSDARLFGEQYPHLQWPQIILSSNLRRCLQMSLEIKAYLDEARPDLGHIRIVAHPGLQEVSNRPCDTGTPLEVLRTEFPTVEFPDEVFPECYPRAADVRPSKWDTIFDDVPHLLAARGQRVREFIKNDLEQTEIIVVTHGSFFHFLLNWWAGEPGKSRPSISSLQIGEAKPFTLPGKDLPGLDFERLVYYAGPIYPAENTMQDFSDKVSLHTKRDCGIFTSENIRNA